MKTIIAATFTPFQHEAQTMLAEPLANALKEQGHEVDIVRLPFDAASERQLDQLFAFRCFDLTTGSGNVFDRLIAIGWAAGTLRHPAKTIWLTTSSDQTALTANGEGQQLAKLSVREAKRWAIASDRTADALRILGANRIELLYPPLIEAAPFTPEPAQGHLVINLPQHNRERSALALQTLQETQMRGICIVRPQDRMALCAAIEEAGLSDLAQPLGADDQTAVGEAVSTAFAILHLDSEMLYCGDVPLGALRARKPLLLAEDAPLRDVFPAGVTIAVKPSARALAETLRVLRNEPQRCEQLGMAGGRFEEKLTWEQTAKRLLA